MYQDNYIEGVVIKPYWGIQPKEKIYIDFSGKMKHDAIGIYDSNKRFIAYVFDKETLDECVQYEENAEVRKWLQSN